MAIVILKKGRSTQTINKTFSDSQHEQNYIALMQRKGYKVDIHDPLRSESDSDRDRRASESISQYIDAQECAQFERPFNPHDQ